MFIKIICVVLLASSVLSRNVPNFKDLDEDEQMLFRAAYSDDTSYTYSQDHAPYNHPYPADYSNEVPVQKLDLLKDGMWALKAKMKELKAFNKALAANLLLTKLTVKELLEGLKVNKLHVEVEPAYHYQPPSYQPQSPPHPQYSAVTPQYSAATPQYSAATPQYSAAAPQYSAVTPQYSAATPQYSAATPQYSAPTPQHSVTSPQYSAAIPQYSATTPQHSATPPQNPAVTPQYSAATPQYSVATPQYSAATPQYVHYGATPTEHDPYHGQ